MVGLAGLAYNLTMRNGLLFLLLALPAFAEYVEVNGVKMYYEVHGEGQPVLLLHGGLNSIQTSFAKQARIRNVLSC
jgi:hypothetical protein